jgi:hypothetical protein
VSTTTTSKSIVNHLKVVMWVHRVFLAFFLLDMLYLLYLLYSSKHSLWGEKSSSSTSKTYYHNHRYGRGGYRYRQ